MGILKVAALVVDLVLAMVDPFVLLLRVVMINL